MTADLSVTGSPDNLLDDRLVERCEEIPREPDPGAYVVIDTMHFSNTVIELLANGAEFIHITDERGDELSYQDSNPDARIGGSSTDAYEPEPGYDFFNSPSYVQQVDVEGRPVSMTSSNGGRAVAALRSRVTEGTDVFVGSTMNAAALGAHLRERDDPVHLVSSGSKGEIAIEDHIGATLISRSIDRVPVADTEAELFRRQLKTAKGADYIESHDIRRRDVLEYAMAIDSRRVVPKLVGERLVDVGLVSEPTAAD